MSASCPRSRHAGLVAVAVVDEIAQRLARSALQGGVARMLDHRPHRLLDACGVERDQDAACP
jgi:hypothetical protein